MLKSEARDIVVQAWCQPETENTEMDVVLAEAFIDILLMNCGSRVADELVERIVPDLNSKGE